MGTSWRDTKPKASLSTTNYSKQPMNLAKIVRLTPDGKEFTTEHGTFYPFQIGFDDQRSGQVNAKTNPPSYRVGEIVGYDVTGKTPRGVDKLKITRNPKPTDGVYQPPAPIDSSNADFEAVSAPSRANCGTSIAKAPTNLGMAATPIHGATVGGALARAVDIWIATNGPESGGWNAGSSDAIEKITRDLVAIQTRIESGGEYVPF